MFSIDQPLKMSTWLPGALVLSALILSGCAGAGIRVKIASKTGVNNDEPISLVLAVPKNEGTKQQMEGFSVEEWFDKNLVEQKELGYIVASLKVNPANLNTSWIYCLNNVEKPGKQSVGSGEPKLYQPAQAWLEIPFDEYARNAAANFGIFVWVKYTRGEKGEVLIGKECDDYCPEDTRKITPQKLETLWPFDITLGKAGITISPQL